MGFQLHPITVRVLRLCDSPRNEAANLVVGEMKLHAVLYGVQSTLQILHAKYEGKYTLSFNYVSINGAKG